MAFSTLLARSLFTAFLLSLGMPNVLLAQVTPANDGTGTVVNANGNQFNIEGGTLSGNGANLFHSLEKLGLNRDQIANFLANPQVRNILTRVVGGDASIINGLIQVSGGNANLYLMNPAGVIFGPNAMVNVAGDFVVTTATGIGFGNNQWFNAVGSNDYQTLIGNPSQFAFDLANPKVIFNAGNLSVGEGKAISLIGGTVINTGTISAPGGDITIAAVPGTSRVKIAKAGNLVSLEVDLLPQSGQALGINPLDLPTLLTEGAQGLGLTVPSNADIVPTPGTVMASGSINATEGGQVALIGQQVGVLNGAIDVSGGNGGGTVRIGGDYQGKGSIPNSLTTVIDSNSQIRADTLTQGNGGTVIVWADGHTQFDGKISAKGGLLGGDGGFVETSAKNQLKVGNTALVNTSSPQGNMGTWLLDPTDLTIVASGGSGTIDGSGNNSSADSSIDSSTIVTALNSTNVNLAADNSITVNQAINASANTNPGNLTLTTLTANLNQPISLSSGSVLSGTPTTVNVGSSGLIQNGVDVITSGGTVNLAAGTYTQGETFIRKSLNIIGNGASNTIIDGNNSARVFNISGIGTTVNLDGLTITNGNAIAGSGGGILVNDGTLTISNSNISGNTATENGGSIYNASGTLSINNSSFSGNSALVGGAIANAGTLTINNSSFLSNQASSTGGAIFNDVSAILALNNSTLSNNSATEFGGGIFNSNLSSVTIDNTNFTNNQATSFDGGGVYNNETATLTITNSTFSDNQAGAEGGALRNVGTATIINSNILGNRATYAGGVGNGGNLTVSNSLFSGNTATENGGGIYNTLSFSVTLDNSRFINNSSLQNGGAIANLGILNTSNSVFDNNTATINGGAIANLRGGDLTAINITGSGNSNSAIYSDAVNLNLDTINIDSILISNLNVSSSLKGTIITSGEQVYGVTNLLADVNLTASNVTFQDTVDGSQALTVNTSGVTYFEKAVGGTTALNSLTTDAAGTTQIKGNVTTTGNQTYNDAVTLQGNSTLTGNNVAFQNTVDGNQALTVNASATNFNGAVNVGNLSTDAAGITNINANITTTGNQIFNDAINLGTDTILTSANTTFNNTVTGDRQLTVNASEATTFNGEVNLAKLITDSVGTTNINANITTSGDQTFGDAVNLQTDITLTSANTTFNNTVAGDRQLTVNASGTTFNGEVNVGKLTVDSARTTNINANINTKGSLTINGEINLNADLTTQGQDLNINGDITLGKIATINTGNNGDINVTGNIQGSHSLNLQAGENLSTQNVDLSNTSGTGGTLALTATSGSINTGNLNTVGSTNGGDITLKAKTAITTGAVITSGQKAGNVFIDPDNDIQVGYINAQSTNGVGGNIDITTARFFRATQTFVDQNGVTASLSSAGSQGGGTITLRYGGNGTPPFTVGNASENGTQGAITSGEYTINPTQSYFFNETVNNISLLNGIDASTPNNPILTTDILGVTILTSPNQQQTSSLPSLSNSLNTFTSPSLQSPIVVAVQDIDHNFTTDYSNQLGLPSRPEIPLDNIPSILRSVQQVTGVKSVLIYVFFRSAKSESLTENSSLWELNRARNSTVNTERRNDDQLQVVLVSEQNILPLAIPGVTREQVLKTSLQLQRNLTNIAPVEYFLPQAKQLYQWLISPLEDALKNEKITNLTFVLDQGLRSLPLAALYDADNQQYIIEKYSVSLIPSLSLTDTTRQDRQGAKVLGMGADTFSDQNPLPAVPTELTEIAKNIWPGQIFLNQDFTIENFKNALNSNQFSIVHLATHGEFKSGDRNNSFVVFSDKKLTLDEFANLGLDRPIDLLTLSACQTALGDPDAELGFAGLAVKTGVRTALGSLWYVSDAGTLALMSSFYNQLKEAPTRADALRQAQLSLLHKKVSVQNNQMIIGDSNNAFSISLPFYLLRNFKNIDISHPYYWSAFTMIGNPW